MLRAGDRIGFCGQKECTKGQETCIEDENGVVFFIHIECVEVGEEDFGQLMSADLYCGV